MEIDLRAIDAAADRDSLADIRAMLSDRGREPASVMAFDLDPFDTDKGSFDRSKRGVEAAQQLGIPLLLTYCFAAIPEAMTTEQAL